MNINYIKNNYKFETLTSNHDLNNFECTSKDLTEFLKKDALKQQENKLNLTKLITCDNEIIGYFSLLTDAIPLKNIREKSTKYDIKNQLSIKSKNKLLPAIKIGRFAIDKRYSGNGIGSDVLLNILYNIKNISENSVGLRFVVVEGYAKAYKFYTEYNNFSNLKKDDERIKEKLDTIIEKNPEQTFYLYLDLKILE